MKLTVRLALLLFSGILALSGCTSSKVGDDGDTLAGDVTDVGPEGDVAPDTLAPECSTNADCVARYGDAGNCRAWACNSQTGRCEDAPVKDYTACDDSDACTVGTVCLTGTCQGGRPLTCNDGNACTQDSCSPATGCAYNPLSSGACDDGDPCTTNDTCAAGACTGESSGTCACAADADCAAFEDGNLCNGTLVCVEGLCRVDAGTRVVCDTSNDPACGATVCVPATGACALETAADGTACDDGTACTASDTCQAGACVGGQNVCPACASKQDCAAFEDGNLCNGTLDCIQSACQVAADTVVRCAASGNACQTNACEPTTGQCVRDDRPNGTACSDGDACTSGDVCANGTCGGAARDCDDGSVCTDDSCVSGTGCVHTAIVCDDEDPCTEDMCDPEDGCIFGENCDDQNACTTDTCGAAGCTHETIDCDDGNACTDDTCDAETGCGHATTSCDDGNACTTDTCDTDLGCVNTALPVDDGDPCTVDACTGGTVTHTPLVCDDLSACTTDACDPEAGCVYTNVVCEDDDICTTDTCDIDVGCVFATVDCNDGIECTVDSCDAELGCVHDDAPCSCETDEECEDGNECTVDYCDPTLARCVHDDLSDAPCDDGDACTINDMCMAGVCTGGANTCADEICDDGEDNDGDLLVDCDDEDCAEECQGCVDDSYEDNDDSSTAWRLDVTSGLELQGLVSVYGDDDFFVMSVCRGATLAVDALFETGLGDIDIYLFDAEGNELASSEGTRDNEAFTWTSTIEGDVYLVVYQYTTDACNAYDLVLGFDGSACAPPEDCFNGVDDDADGAADCVDSDCSGTIAREGACTNPADLPIAATVDVAAIGAICIIERECLADPICNTTCIVEQTGLSTECASCGGALAACTFENCALACVDAASTECETCIRDACYPAYVECFGLLHCAFEFSCNDETDDDGDGLVDCLDPDCAADPICAPPCVDDLLEDNDTLETATAFELGTTLPNLVAVDTDLDWFRFDVCAGGVVTIDVQFKHADGDIDIELDDNGGDFLEWSMGTEDGEQIVWTFDYDGAAYLRVRQATREACNAYSVTVTFDATGCGVVVPEDCFDDADNDGDARVDCDDSDCSGAITREGACTNPADLAIVASVDVSVIGQSCIIDAQCLGDVACNTACVQDNTGLSADCSGCGGALAACAFTSCVLPCMDPTAPGCQTCIQESCYPAYEQCFGLLHCAFEYLCDNDGDDDGDGLVDCRDPDCAADPICETVCEDDMYEDNDTLETAMGTVIGIPVSGLALLAGDDDFWSVTVCAGAVLSASATFDATAGAIGFELLDANGEVLAMAEPVEGGAALQWTSTIDGAVYLRATLLADSGCNTYGALLALDETGCGVAREICDDDTDNDDDGAVDCDDADCLLDPACPQTCEPDAFEPNESRAEAKALPLGATRATMLDGELDWYALDVCAGGLVTIAADFDGLATDIDIHLYDGNGTQVDSSASYESHEEVTGRFDTAQTVYLRVREYSTTACTPYVLTTTVTCLEVCDDEADNDDDQLVDCDDPDCAGQPACCVNDAFEPNDDPTEAAPLTPGTYEGVLATAESDWYALELCTGAVLTVTATFDPSVDIDIALTMAGGGRVLASSTGVEGTETFTFTNELRERAFALHVYDGDGVICHPYGLVVAIDETECVGPVEICTNGTDDDGDGFADCDDIDCVDDPTCCEDDGYEPNDTPDVAATLAVGGDDLVMASDDDDWFLVELCAGAVMTATATFDSNALDIDIAALDAGGTLLGISEGSSDIEEFTYTNETGEALTAYFIAYEYSGAGNCQPYTLRFVIDETGCAGPQEICTDGIDNDGDALVDCADTDCAMTRACALRINEIHYNPIGDDRPLAFIELWGAPDMALDGYRLVARNGDGGADYARFALTNLRTDAAGYLLIAHPSATPELAATADVLNAIADLQNGPIDSLRLEFLGADGYTTVDALGYAPAGPVPTTIDFETAPALNTTRALSRSPLHVDTNDNSVDFLVCDPTPKAESDACWAL